MTYYTWSTTASSNNIADTTINWREGQSPSTINNSARAMMAAAAKDRKDRSGELNTGGSSTAFTVTSNQGYTSLADGISITVRMHTTNGASATLNVDGLGAKAIRTATSTAAVAGTMTSGSIYKFTYDSGDDCWYVHSFYTVTTTDFTDSTFRISDNGDSTKKVAFEISGVTTATVRTLTVPNASGTLLLSGDIGSTVQAFDADTLKADTYDTLTVGFDQTTFNAGSKSSGTFTPDIANGAFQIATNDGAHTLAPPGNDSTSLTMVVRYTNGGSAGAITTSGFTKVIGSFNTTSANVFFCFITRMGGYKFLNIQQVFT